MDDTHPKVSPPVGRIILYVRDIPKVAAFYQQHFGMTPMPGAAKGWLELASPAGGCTVALHQAAVSQKSGAAMKLVFAVEDVRGFKAARAIEGLEFGPVHNVGGDEQTAGFEFANAKDPAGNAISISSRGMRTVGAAKGN
jgi:predicted enzyme related to lactoylglutathione lyase